MHYIQIGDPSKERWLWVPGVYWVAGPSVPSETTDMTTSLLVASGQEG